MFFSIGFNAQSNFPHCYQLANFYISTDAGWHVCDIGQYTVIYKGYAEQFDLATNLDRIVSQRTPEFLGNFCALVLDHQTNLLHIKTDRYRGFPIYIHVGQAITNLEPSVKTAWTDSMVTVQSDLSVSQTQFDVIGPINTTPLTWESALDLVHARLCQRTQDFLSHNRRPIKVFLSGGVDSLLVYSYLQKFTKDYELLNNLHIDFDYFWIKNSSTIRKNWAYHQIHHWTTPCVLTSGCPGDEFMLRSPSTVGLLAQAQGLDLLELLANQTWRDCLMKDYFELPKNKDILQKTSAVTHLPLDKFHRYLSNTVVNDWQHWHLDNTLTWTPLRDLEIFKTLLRLPFDLALPQILNADFSRALIERNALGLTGLMSPKKNTGNTMANLADLLLKT